MTVIQKASSIVEPINTLQKQVVIEQTSQYIVRAKDIFGQQFSPIDVLFDLKGKSAGMFRIKLGVREIRYNPYIFAKYFDDNLANTVPHEVAHYICDAAYGSRNIRAHGVEWKNLMQAFGVVPQVTGNYDLTGIPIRKYRKFEYHCGCRSYALTSRRHNAITLKRKKYFCKFCEAQLIIDAAAV